MPVELRERRAKRSEPEPEDIPVLPAEDRTVEPPKKRRRKVKKTPKKTKKDCAEKKTKKQPEAQEDEQKVPKPKKKYPYKYRPRPNAAVKERERLVVFNQAFAQLQDKLPERLQLSQEKRMPKKLILRFAVRYIKYLQEELERGPGEPAPAEMAMSPEEHSLWGTGDEEEKGSEVGWQIGGSPVESSASESSMEFIDLCELPSPFRAAAGKLDQLAPRAGEGTPGLATRPPAVHTRAPGGNTGKTNEPCTVTNPRNSPLYRTHLPNTQLTHRPLCKCAECSTPLLSDDLSAAHPATPPDHSAAFPLGDYLDFFPSYVDSIPDIRGELPSLPDDFSPDSPLATVPLSMFELDSRLTDRPANKGSPVYHQPLSPYTTQVTSPSFYDDDLHFKLVH
ncbi:hypothetical protein Bbelb_191640 [Branchiostoma belcheri]|nr:hypothetical protein Bbelb_191640 [Branchiostoma belcheri]